MSKSILQSTDEKCDELAAQVLAPEFMPGFRALDVQAKLAAIIFFATISDDDNMRESAEARIRSLGVRS